MIYDVRYAKSLTKKLHRQLFPAVFNQKFNRTLSFVICVLVGALFANHVVPHLYLSQMNSPSE